MKKFTSSNGMSLFVEDRRSAVVLHLEFDHEETYRFNFDFDSNTFHKLYKYLLSISKSSWKNFQPKEADSFAADYDEYYDRTLDNNGYLKITEQCLHLERPSLCSRKLYQFNKRKMESFLYDFLEILENNTDS